MRFHITRILHPTQRQTTPSSSWTHKPNYRPIVNYIPRAANCEEGEVEIAAGVSIKLKSSAKTKLENVTPAQWTVANARILAELLDETPASDTKRVTSDYLSHIAKMGELATRYTWSSVILLDDEYRRQQAAYGFCWGSDTPHTSMLVLHERAKQKHKHLRSTIKPQESPVCHMYKKLVPMYSEKTCTYGRGCRFRHACATCGSDHPRVHHSATLTSQD